MITEHMHAPNLTSLGPLGIQLKSKAIGCLLERQAKVIYVRSFIGSMFYDSSNWCNRGCTSDALVHREEILQNGSTTGAPAIKDIDKDGFNENQSDCLCKTTCRWQSEN